MYQPKAKKFALIALLYYVIMLLGYVIMGLLYQQGMKEYVLINWFHPGLALFIVFLQGEGADQLGFARINLRTNAKISGLIIVVVMGFALLYSDLPLHKLLQGAFYYLFTIAFVEELIFRGFLQNYLYGLRWNRKLIFILGALLFSFIHLPFQMIIQQRLSLDYVVMAFPQLVFTFLLHLFLCYVTSKRKDVLIPIALHFALNYVQALL